MEAVRSYRDLLVWQKGVDLCVELYRATEAFPDHERYGLQSQIRRAGVSISSNVAEGHQRSSTQDYIRFCRMAKGSTGEVDTQLEIGRRLGYLKEPKHKELLEGLVEIRRMLSGLIASLEARRDGAGKVQEEASLYVCDGMPDADCDRGSSRPSLLTPYS